MQTLTSKISLPVFINASTNKILIVGGGKLASEQLNDLMQNVPQANISVVARGFLMISKICCFKIRQ